jgi:hypothetical protein
MGPNARPRRLKDMPPREPLTHEQVDKMLRPPKARRPGINERRWIIKTTFYSGDVAYWGTKRDGDTGLTPYRSNADRYESENAALYVGYEMKAAKRIGEFTVEQLPERHLAGGGGGTGGRA